MALAGLAAPQPSYKLVLLLQKIFITTKSISLAKSEFYFAAMDDFAANHEDCTLTITSVILVELF
jgi:hypothetical protein